MKIIDLSLPQIFFAGVENIDAANRHGPVLRQHFKYI